MPEPTGIEYLRNKMMLKKVRNDLRYAYYESKYTVNDLRISTPPHLYWMNAVLGWCAKGVDMLSDRLVFREFRDDNFAINEIYEMNNPDILFDSAILSALITACSFIYISAGDDGYPRLQVIDGSNATGIIEPITGMLKEGYAVLSRDEFGMPVNEAYFLPGRTDYYEAGKFARSFEHEVDYPLLVPVVFRPDARRPFGHSRISRACMDHVQSAARTVKRSEISAEFYSFPQRYVLGLSDDAEVMDKWRATMSSMLDFRKDADRDKPVVGQFQQQSMGPHIEHLRAIASLFAGETGLTLDDLGFATENPSSAEAIKAAHEPLRLTARKAQRSFGSGFLNAGYLAACLRDNFKYRREQLYLTKPIWEPIFEPDAAALSLIGDGAIKINQAIPGYIAGEELRDLTGIKSAIE